MKCMTSTQPSILAQTYSLYGGKPPEVSPAEACQMDELSDEDRQAIRTMMESDGWRILTKVWAKYEYQLLLDIVRASQDHRFSQGKYAGYKLHEELALRASRKREEPKPPPRSRSYCRTKGSTASAGDA